MLPYKPNANPCGKVLMLRISPQMTPGTDQERPYRDRGDP